MVYQVQVATDFTFKKLVVNKIVEDTTDYTLVKDLIPFTVYYWRVKAINPLTGAQSAWSTPCTFRVKASDVIIEHDIDAPISENSYMWFITMEHKFVRDYDTECELPIAQIGVGICNDMMDVQIGVGYCPGVCTPQFDGFELEIIFIEANEPLYTEDGYMLALEF